MKVKCQPKKQKAHLTLETLEEPNENEGWRQNATNDKNNLI